MRCFTIAAASVLTLVFLSGGCLPGGNERPNSGFAPTVVGTLPADAAVEVAVDTTITVTFNQPMDATTVDASTLLLEGPDGSPVPVSVSYDDNIATITPLAPLSRMTTYTVSVGTGALGLNGKPLKADFVWTFQTGHWAPTATSGAPTARTGHTAVWTGAEMIVWGGTPATLAGGRYNPATDSWQAMNVENAPAPRTGHTAIWTGAEMIVWGGTAGTTGARYDPATDTWRTVSSVGAPTSQNGHVAVAADGDMIVWGGATESPLGAIYHPATDTWYPMATPETRGYSVAVWTGSRMVMWGGGSQQNCDPGDGGCIHISHPELNTGASYDPKTDTWTPISIDLAPTARTKAVSCWTGDRMFVWGGASSSPTAPAFTLTTGGAYLPAQDKWVPMAMAGAPTDVTNPRMAWIGSRLLVWSSDHFGCAAYYDPKTDGWSAMPTAGAPATREGAVGIGTGTEFIVWGGEGQSTGGRFLP